MFWLRRIVEQFQTWMQNRFPYWSHAAVQRKWERKWDNPTFNPFWRTERPQKEFLEAINSGWFRKEDRIYDIGCGTGETCRWFAAQGFPVLGFDFSTVAVDTCRRLSQGSGNWSRFQVADFCAEGLRIEPVRSVIDRGCFHRIPKFFRPVFARNVARMTLNGGHFLLLAGTFQRTQYQHMARSEDEIREEMKQLFSEDFEIERAEPAVINAAGDQEPMPAVAFWMVRKPVLYASNPVSAEAA